MHKAGAVVCGLVLLWAAWAMLNNLHMGPLAVYDEGTYAQVTKESFERGDFLTFTLYENLWFEKPPVYFWLAGVAIYITGNEVVGIRLPAALFAVAVVAMTILLAWQATKQSWVAALAGVLLVTAQPFVEGAREARLDLLVVFFILLALWAVVERRYYVFGAAAGLAVLSKSVVGIFAFVPLLFYWPVSISALYIPAAIFVALVAPWHLYEWYRWGNEFIHQYIGYHLLSRYEVNLFGSPDLQTDYIARLFERAKPLMGALLVSVVAVPLYIRSLSSPEKRYMLAVACTLGAMILIFFTAQTRALSYLIPLYPFAALFISLSLYHLSVHKYEA